MKYIPESEFEQAVQAAFPVEVTRSLLRALRNGYNTAVDKHAPEEGGNESTFGTGVYEYTTFQLIDFAMSSAAIAQVLTRHPSFRLSINGFSVSNHRVGDHEGENINGCFPNKDTAARHAARRVRRIDPNQLSFLPLDEEQDKRVEMVPCNLVLAHLGNPEHGLCAVYLCRPGKVDKNRIVSWDYVTLIWKRDEAEKYNAPDVQLPAEEIIEEAPVRRKSKKNKASGNG